MSSESVLQNHFHISSHKVLCDFNTPPQREMTFRLHGGQGESEPLVGRWAWRLPREIESANTLPPGSLVLSVLQDKGTEEK